MTNENKKVKKKFKEALTDSQTPNNGAIAVSFQKDTVLINGLNSNSVKPHFAVLHSFIEDKETFQYWSPVTKNSNENIILAFNLKKADSPILYAMNIHQIKEEALKFDQKNLIKNGNFILLYWEIDNYSFFSFVFKDPNSDQTIIECQFNIKYSSKIFHRKLLSTLLPKRHSMEIEKTLNKFESKAISINEVENEEQE